MSTDIVDYWLLGHFVSGYSSYVLLKSIKLNTTQNFILSNGVHYLLELLEDKGFYKKGYYVKNHVLDLLVFLLGWLISYLTKAHTVVPSEYYPLIWAFTFMTFIKELFRELVGRSHDFKIDQLYTIFILILALVTTYISYSKNEFKSKNEQMNIILISVLLFVFSFLSWPIPWRMKWLYQMK